MRRALATIVVAAAACRGGASKPPVVATPPAQRALLDHVPADTGALIVLDGESLITRVAVDRWHSGHAGLLGEAARLHRQYPSPRAMPSDDRAFLIAFELLDGMSADERARAGLSPSLDAVAYLWGLVPVVRVRGDGRFVLERITAAATAAGLTLPIEHRGAHAYVRFDAADGHVVVAFEPHEIAAAYTVTDADVLDHLIGVASPAQALTSGQLEARTGASTPPLLWFDPDAIAHTLDGGGPLVDAMTSSGAACHAAEADVLANLPRVSITTRSTRDALDTTLAVGPAPNLAVWLRRNLRPTPRLPPPRADMIVVGTGLPFVDATLAVADLADAIDRAMAPCGFESKGVGRSLAGSLPPVLRTVTGLTVVVDGADPEHMQWGYVFGVDDPLAFWTWGTSAIGVKAPAKIGDALDVPILSYKFHVVIDRDAIAVGMLGFEAPALRALLAAPRGPRSVFTGWLDPDVTHAISEVSYPDGAPVVVKSSEPSVLRGNTTVDADLDGDTLRLRVHEQIDPQSQRSTH